MAKYVGGDILGITLNHPTLGSFNFSTKSKESYTIDHGGYRSNDDDDAVTGGGEMIDQVNRKRWSFEGPIVLDFSSDVEGEAYEKIAKSSDQGTWTFSHISGATWRGKGKFVGDFTPDTNTAQASVKIAGGGKLGLLR